MKSKTRSTIQIDTFLIPFPYVSMSNKARREGTLIRVLGITSLTILMLMDVTGAAPFAYVTSLGVDTGTVFVIDTATDNVTAVVPVGGWPAGVSVNPTGTKVYVATGLDPTVSVIDTATNTVSDTMNTEEVIPGELQSTLQEQGFM
jgi:YVTN family beta-propeller protein